MFKFNLCKKDLFYNSFLVVSILIILLSSCKKESKDPDNSNSSLSIQWQKCYGGTNLETFMYSSVSSKNLCSDGGIIFNCTSTSNDGDITNTLNNSGMNAWLVKTLANGDIQWEKCFGGSNENRGSYVMQTSDGGFVLAITTLSNDGDAIGNHGSHDILIIKTDGLGNKQWSKCFGGSASDLACKVIQTNDGGYAFTGSSSSIDGDKLFNHGINNTDVWFVKIDSVGNIQWQKSFGGSDMDEDGEFIQTSDGGYILLSNSTSSDGDLNYNHGGWDSWIAKLNSLGDIVWQRSYGGSLWDGSYDIIQTSDGGYAFSGTTFSIDGDLTGVKTSSVSQTDFWIVKISSIGSIQWQSSYGGSKDDGGGSIVQKPDGTYYVVGIVESNDGDISGNHGGDSDGWCISLSSQGALQSQTCIGGSSTDFLVSILTNAQSNSYVFLGMSDSHDYGITGNHGADIWAVKFD